jgi:short subunit dehydrogenase-like uncharacterized protein
VRSFGAELRKAIARARDFDVAVYGATGFTGRLVSRYLVRRAGAYARIALAGRSVERLERLRSQIASELPLDNQPSVVLADAADDDSLRALASRSRAVVSVVGPYARLGTPLVQACVACGAHYVDINGETPWVRGVIDELHGAAMSAGVRIVPNCGYSVLSDLGVLFTVRAVRRAFGTPARAVSSLVHFNGRLSGGTLATGIALDRLPASVQVERRDPFLLGGAPSGGPRPEDADPAAARYEAALGAWSAPFWMASISTRVVRRSFGLLRETALDEPYAVDFAYREAALARDEGVARNLATPMAPPEQRQRLIDRGRLPGPGEGPSAEARASSWFRSYFLGESTDGRRLLTSISGGDPGYEETSKIVGEAALLLALEHDALPASGACGGVLTPAVALGGALLDRLDGCGLRFAVRGTDLADDLPRMVADDFVRPIA